MTLKVTSSPSTGTRLCGAPRLIRTRRDYVHTWTFDENRLASSTNYVIRTRQYAASRGEGRRVCVSTKTTPGTRTATARRLAVRSRDVRARVTTHRAGKHPPRQLFARSRACNRHNNKRSALPRAARERVLHLVYTAQRHVDRPQARPCTKYSGPRKIFTAPTLSLRPRTIVMGRREREMRLVFRLY